MANLNRRKFIIGILSTFGLVGLSAWLGKAKILTWIVRKERDSEPKMTFAPNSEEDICVLSSPISEGPYYLKSPLRSDIREDRKGKILNLKFTVVDYPSCSPIENAIVEIWHCDAHGNYGGFPEGIGHNLWETAKLLQFGKKNRIDPTTEKIFLRGFQKTDSEGHVEFTTIVPGWYDPRVPHIHFKIILDNQEHLTSELYLEEEFCNQLFTTKAPYNQYGKSPYNFKNDGSLANIIDGKGLLLKPVENLDETTVATAKIGIKRT